ncbi:MAG: tRNA uridine-5-carboxymethylaminomethyl(34) synthesis GTPase MnmE [Ignavibacteriaceae bacterium]
MKRSVSEDTIAAIATPSGVGAISVIRVSGEESFAAVDSIFQGKVKLVEADSHTIHYGKIVDLDSEMIDDVLVSVFRNPHSYTGEDSVEISTHGNPFIAKKILELLVHKNVRLAEAGEFTKRAFLNNKLDLAQAEAVADVISSRTEASLQGARNQLDGLLSQKVEELRSMLVNASSFVELELDFAEEDLEFIGHDELLGRIDKISKEIEKLLETYSFGRVIRDGINVALVGSPNVGKSSLLNYILKEYRAIVSSIPGTTRDVIREDVSIDGILFRLYDTAGIRVSEDEIEKEGVLRSREVVKNSDVVLFINDVVQGVSKGLKSELLSLSKKDKILTVLNKIDIAQNQVKEADICISAKTGEGIETLFKELKETALGTSSYSEKSAVVSNLRHYNCLKKANESLGNARESVNNKLSEEFIAVDLRNAADNLGEIIGEVTSDDILNNIFTKFCIGK